MLRWPPRRDLVRGRVAALASVLVFGLLAACVSADVPESLPGPTSTTTTTAAPTEAPDCGDPAASLRPTGPATTDVPAGSRMARIKERGFLLAGADTGTLRMSFVDPATGDFAGFDVDVAREVAWALFGDRDPDRVRFVGIPSSDRVQVLVDGEVDLVADVFTPTCGRREDVDFSTNYYQSEQKVLVRDDDPADSVGEMDGHEICSAAGTTTLANIDELENAVGVPAPERADCLVWLQQGRVDGITTNDTILVGFAAQDPNLRFLEDAVPPGEPTAIGLPKGEDEWVRYVNAVLEDLRESGRWRELYDQHLGDQLGEPDAEMNPPAPAYVD